ncbi:hypothetical protein B0H14DRAFT_1554995 [Mycena olivaceomarginata]|nr:hypothetical protein B0H14DRAFT_1554995 [Mycena olivaceomarginata]
MRPLTEEESRAVFEKLANYIGKNLIHLIDRPDGPYCFRLQKDRVYYVSEESMRLGISIARPNLVSLGTCFGKFSKSGKFKLHITALDYLAKYAKYKVWIKPNGEMPLPIREPRPQSTPWAHYRGHAGASRSRRFQYERHAATRATVDTRKLDPTSIIIFHQADVGEYLRDEDTLF